MQTLDNGGTPDNTGEPLEKIELSAPQASSCAFGGKELDELYITTARSGLPEVEFDG